jgi:hypothetical protein
MAEHTAALNALRLHLVSEHKNTAALELSDREAEEQHNHEHLGPGTIRGGHTLSELGWDPGVVARLLAEEHEAQARVADQITVALTPVQALAIAAGRPHVGKTRDGRRVHVRLYTPDEWIAERAGAGEEIGYTRAELTVAPAVLRPGVVRAAAPADPLPGWPDPDARPSY